MASPKRRYAARNHARRQLAILTTPPAQRAHRLATQVRPVLAQVSGTGIFLDLSVHTPASSYRKTELPVQFIMGKLGLGPSETGRWF